jgi:allantoinase
VATADRAALAIEGTALVDGALRPAVVTVVAGRVADVLPAGTPVAADERVALAGDEVLLPGLVDSHVHVNEPGRTAWEGFATATRAAATGGVTTLVDMPLNSVPATTDVAALEAKRRAAAGQCHVDVAFWGGAVPASLGRLAELHAAGVLGFKSFLVDSGVPEFPPLSWEQLDAALAEVAGFDGLLIVHAEDAEVLADAPAPAGPSYASFLASRPPEAEQAAITGLLLGAGRYDARVHVLHLSSAAAVPRLRRARQAGIRVTVETCPHYLTLDADRIGDGRTEFKCCPPIRDAANRDRLWEALAEGVVDCVVSDHSPSTPDLKRLDTGDFGAAWGGIASVQLGLPATWTAARERGVPLADVVDWMSAGPAAVAGLPHKGAIAAGRDADLVVFAPDEAFVVDPARLQHRHPLTPYAGRELTGAVRRVWLGGATVVRDGEPVGPPLGRLLRRQG